jgi:erythromycin esterase
VNQAYDPVVSWIQEHARPIHTFDPQAPLDDLASFKQIIGDASIVGLGEASHGGHEFFVMKHRLLRFLVEEMGFTMFAMEMCWMGAEPINDYILNGIGEPEVLLVQNGYGIWNTEEVLDLLLWMRAYNADPQHQSKKVRFAGFDAVLPRTASLERIVRYFEAVDPAYHAQVEDLYKGVGELSFFNLPAPSVLQSFTSAAKQVFMRLNDYADDYRARSSPHAFSLILQEARVVTQAMIRVNDAHAETQSDAFKTMAQRRDHFMAENVAWLHEYADGGEKMVLWAHNWHIGTWGIWNNGLGTDRTPFTWMGMDIRQRYQAQYLTIGFSFHEGAHSAVPVDQNGKPVVFQRQSCTIQPAAVGSYHDTLAKAGRNYFLDVRVAPPVGEIHTWLEGPHPFRDFGAGHPSDDSHSYLDLSLEKWFDVLIEIQTISPSHRRPKP